VEPAVVVNLQIGREGGRGVGIVGIGIVDPEEELPVPVLLEPRENPLVDLRGVQVPSFLREAVFIDVESLVQPELRLENAQRDEGGGGEAVVFENHRQEIHMLLPERLSVVVVFEGVRWSGSEQGSMGGKGYRDQAVSVFEPDPLSGQGVDVGRSGVARVVGAYVVGSLGVEGDPGEESGEETPEEEACG